MRFRFIEEHRDAFCAKRMCDVLEVSSRGLRAYRSRPASQRQRTDMVVLAHIKEQSRLSLGSYGRPRMTEELKELGLNVGHRRVGRLMRENGIRVERSKKYKVTTIARQAFCAANLPRGGQQPRLQHRAEPVEPGLPSGPAQSEMGRRHQLCLDARRLAVSRCHSRPAFTAGDRLGRQQSHEAGFGDPGIEDGRGAPPAFQGLHPPYRSRQPILFSRLSEAPAPARLPGIDERQRKLL